MVRLGRKNAVAALGLAALSAGAALGEKLTLTSSYPVPSGVYNQLITTGDKGTTPADTTFNRNAGNTILIPPTNTTGRVGIGTATPGQGTNALLTIQGPDRGDPPNGPPGTQVDLFINGRIMSGDSLGYGGMWVNGLTRTQFVGQGGPWIAPVTGTVGNPDNLTLWNRGFALQVDSSRRVSIDVSPHAALTDSLTVGTDGGSNGNITASGSITANGTITSNSPSDARLKKNISPVTGALEKMQGLHPVRFEWKEDFAARRRLSGEPQWGLLAQDVEKVLPELVSQDPDNAGYKRVKYGAELNMLALAAIKELQAETEAQRKQIEELQAALKTLQAPRR